VQAAKSDWMSFLQQLSDSPPNNLFSYSSEEKYFHAANGILDDHT